MKIIRDEGIENELFLHTLYNKYGAHDLELCSNYNVDDEMYFSKWIKYNDLIHLKQNEKPEGVGLTKKYFIKNVTHRSILPCEIMIDVDDALLKGVNMFGSILEKSKWIVSELRKEGIEPAVYFTGNKSYHISYIEPMLQNVPDYQKVLYKQEIINKYGGDIMKAGRSLISMEGTIHYKSGKIKQRVFL